MLARGRVEASGRRRVRHGGDVAERPHAGVARHAQVLVDRHAPALVDRQPELGGERPRPHPGGPHDGGGGHGGAVGELDALGAHGRSPMPGAARTRAARAGRWRTPPGGRRARAGCGRRASTSSQRRGTPQLRVVAGRVAAQVLELGHRLDARVAAADEHEREPAPALGLVGSGRGQLELAEHVVSQVDRLGHALEPDRVLEQAGDRCGARHRAERDHEGVERERHRPALGSCTATVRAARSTASARPSTSRARGHITRTGTTTWRGSTVPEAASGRSGV